MKVSEATSALSSSSSCTSDFDLSDSSSSSSAILSYSQISESRSEKRKIKPYDLFGNCFLFLGTKNTNFSFLKNDDMGLFSFCF